MKRIRELRAETGLSQDQIAPLIGITRGILARYEDGTRNPSVENLQIIADYFKTSTDYLLERTDRRKPYPKSKQ